MNAAIYARKSQTQGDVAEDARSVPRQIAGARQFITSMGWHLDESHVFIDDGISGALFKGRPGFTRMMKEANASSFEAVVIYDFDRFARDARYGMEAMYKLSDYGVSVWDFSTGLEIGLDTAEERMATIFKAEGAQQYRDKIKKHTKNAMLAKFKSGFVAGSRVFGYDIIGPKGTKKRAINEAEADVVRRVFKMFAAGMTEGSIALQLNSDGVKAPRGNKWATSTIRSLMTRPLYRGRDWYGRRSKVEGKDLPRRLRDKGIEKTMLSNPRDTWIPFDFPELKIIDDQLLASVDARLAEKRVQWKASKEANKHRPTPIWGKYLLTGGLLRCPTCSGHFEVRRQPGWEKVDGKPVFGAGKGYQCANRTRRPGSCTNMLVLDLERFDDAVLSGIEDEILAPWFVDELIAALGEGPADNTARLTKDRARLQKEIHNLVQLGAQGVKKTTLAADIETREVEIERIEAELKKPPVATTDQDKLRAVLRERQRVMAAEIRSSTDVARLVVRRLIGPITVWHEDGNTPPTPEWAKKLGGLPSPNERPRRTRRKKILVKWEAKSTADGLLQGLVRVAESQTGN